MKKEFIDELGMSQNALANAINVPPNRIHGIVRGQRGITADTDLRLCRFFGLSTGYFLRLQLNHEIFEAERSLANEIADITPLTSAIKPF